jgi:alpha-L-rhamnosidase
MISAKLTSKPPHDFPHLAIRIGDLRLQALCSYATFKDYDLAKRCLYLFAGMPFNDEGLLCACVYEKPKPYFGGNCIGEPGCLPTTSLCESRSHRH